MLCSAGRSVWTFYIGETEQPRHNMRPRTQLYSPLFFKCRCLHFGLSRHDTWFKQKRPCRSTVIDHHQTEVVVFKTSWRCWSITQTWDALPGDLAHTHILTHVTLMARDGMMGKCPTECSHRGLCDCSEPRLGLREVQFELKTPKPFGWKLDRS